MSISCLLLYIVDVHYLISRSCCQFYVSTCIFILYIQHGYTGLMPYIELAANSILLLVGGEFFQQTLQQRLEYIDSQLTEILSNGEQYTKPKDLSSFPVPGLPGWDIK